VENVIDQFAVGAFRDWAQMDAFPVNVRTAVEATIRDKAKAYEPGGILSIPNPAILVSAKVRHLPRSGFFEVSGMERSIFRVVECFIYGKQRGTPVHLLGFRPWNH
jgi:hypothetical protein